MNTDLAASYRRFTPRQRAQAATRYDREARATLAACEAQRDAESRAKHVAKARWLIERLGVCLLTGCVRGREGVTPLTAEQRALCQEALRDGWRTLKRHADFVTVLS